MQMEQLQKKIGFIWVPNLAINVTLRIAFIGQFIEKISRKAGLTTPISSSPIATVDKTRLDHVLTVESHESRGQPERFAAGQPCVAT